MTDVFEGLPEVSIGMSAPQFTEENLSGTLLIQCDTNYSVLKRKEITMKSKSMRMGVLLFLIVLLAGCLDVKETEYNFKLQEDDTMTGTIRFNDIVSCLDDDEDVSGDDFNSLLNDYIEGDDYETGHPYLKLGEKHFEISRGVLNASVNFTMEDAAEGGFLIDSHCRCAPIYLVLPDDFKPVLYSNGEVSGDDIFIRWPTGTKEFLIRVGSESDFNGSISLAPRYEAWRAGN